MLRGNCFVVSNFSDGIFVSNSTFQSYKHRINSIIIAALSSVVTIAGAVYGENSDIYIHIKAQVAFGSGHNVAVTGGAMYLTNGIINIGIQSM